MNQNMGLQPLGATTLTANAASVSSHQVTPDFKGKSDKQHHLVLEDKALARSIGYCQEIPGQRLFQYLDEDGTRVQVGSTDVNDYLKAVTGEDLQPGIFARGEEALVPANSCMNSSRTLRAMNLARAGKQPWPGKLQQCWATQ